MTQPNIAITPLKFSGPLYSLVEDGRGITVVLNYHFERCKALSIVRITAAGLLSSCELVDPSVEPWILMCGEYHGFLRYFIVNKDDYYLPVVIGRYSDPNYSTVHEYSIMNPYAYTEAVRLFGGEDGGGWRDVTYEWDKFSSIDLEFAKQAVAFFLESLKCQNVQHQSVS